MKKTAQALVISILTMLLLLTVLQMPIMATTNEKIHIIKNSENEYLLYVGNYLNTAFEFALSKDENETSISYISSILDNENNNIAYVNSELKEKFFNADNTAYLWIRKSGEVVVKAQKVNLQQAKTEQELNDLSKLTQKITIKSNADEEYITIDVKENEKTDYVMFSLESKEEFVKLSELINELANFSETTKNYEKVDKYIELIDLYKALLEESAHFNWLVAKENKIAKPYTESEQQYILWLKDDDGNVDFQILTSYQNKVTVTEKQITTVEVTNKLPTTYDENSYVYIALAISSILLAIMVIVRLRFFKNNKED